MLTHVLLWIATTFFTTVGLLSVAFVAIKAVALFWRFILVALGAILFASYADVRPLVEAFVAIGVLGWGWEHWRAALGRGEDISLRRFAGLAN